MIDQNTLDKLFHIMDEFEFNHYEEFDEELQKSFQEARDVLVDTKGQDEVREVPKAAVEPNGEMLDNLFKLANFELTDRLTKRKEQDDG